MYSVAFLKNQAVRNQCGVQEIGEWLNEYKKGRMEQPYIMNAN